MKYPPMLTDHEKYLLGEFVERLFQAREKHKVFAEGAFQALGYLGEEYGEVSRAITKNEGIERLQSELLDVLVVAFRMLNKEYE